MTTVSIICAAVLVGLSGVFSGLNLGLMSFTDEDLRVIVEGSDKPDDVKNAKRIQPLRKRGNLLLCTLLLGNTLVNAVIAILLAEIASGVVGGLVTTALIVVFGEIIPQSVCSRHALYVGAKAVPLVWIFMIICFPVAYPISLVLDYFLGQEVSESLTKRKLLTILQINLATHRDELMKEATEKKTDVLVDVDDMKVVAGALTFADKTLDQIMTPLSEALCISEEAVLDKDTLTEVLSQGHTRIPVFRSTKDHIVALLYSKDLVGMGFERGMPVKHVIETFDAHRRVHRFARTQHCGDAFQRCKRDRVHMMIICEEGSKKAVGIATTEDIIEEVLQEQLVDDDDQFIDMRPSLDIPGTPKRPNERLPSNPQRYDPAKLLKQISSSSSRPALERKLTLR